METPPDLPANPYQPPRETPGQSTRSQTQTSREERLARHRTLGLVASFGLFLMAAIPFYAVFLDWPLSSTDPLVGLALLYSADPLAGLALLYLLYRFVVCWTAQVWMRLIDKPPWIGTLLGILFGLSSFFAFLLIPNRYDSNSRFESENITP